MPTSSRPMFEPLTTGFDPVCKNCGARYHEHNIDPLVATGPPESCPLSPGELRAFTADRSAE